MTTALCTLRRCCRIVRPTRHPIALAALLAASAAPLAAHAITYTWTGLATNSNSWDATANWQNGTAPPANGLDTADLVFGVSSRVFPTVPGARSIRSLTFNSGASLYTFDVGPLTLGAGGIAQNAANPQGFSAPVVLGANQTWSLASGTGALSFGNGLNTTGSGGTAFALTINASTATGNGNIVDGVISGGGSLTKTGAGILTLTGNSTYTGTTTVASGTLAIASGGAMTGGDLKVNAGATLDVSGTVALRSGSQLIADGSNATAARVTLIGSANVSAPTTFIGGVGNATVDQIGGGFNTVSLYVGGDAGHVGNYNLSGGSLTTTRTQLADLAGTGIFNQSGGKHTTSALMLAGAITSAQAVYNLDGGTLVAGMVGGAVNGGSSTFNFNGGTLQASGSSASFLQGMTTASVRAGGARINIGGLDVTIAQNLVHDTTPGAALADGGLTVVGFGGRLTLTGANSYTGATTIPVYVTLQLGNGGTTGSIGGGEVILRGGELVFNRSDNLSFANAISGAGSLTKNGAGILTLTGSGTVLASTTVNAGTLVVAASSNETDLGDDVLVGAGARLVINSAVRGPNVDRVYLLLDGRIGNVASVDLNGAGKLSINFADIGYSGPGIFNQNGGSLTASDLSVGSETGSSTYNLGGGGLITGGTQVGSKKFSVTTGGVFTQSGGVHTTPTLNLAGGSTSNRGTYNLDGGVLAAGAITSSGDGEVTGNSIFNFNGGTLRAGSGNASFLQGLTLATVRSGGAFIDTAGFDVTIAQPLLRESAAGQSFGALTKLGAGTLTLTGANTYTGGTSFEAGILNVGSTGALGSTGPLIFSGGTLQYSAANKTDYSARFFTAPGQMLSIDTNGQDVTFATGLTSAGGSLVKLGAGTLTLTGANTFGGGLTIAAGTLAVPQEASLGAANVVTVGGGGSLLFTRSATLFRTYNLGVATLAIGSGNTLTLGSGSIVNGGFLAGAGSTVLGTGSRLDGVTASAGSTLAQTSGTATVDGATIGGTLTVGGRLNTRGTALQGVTTIGIGGTLANSGSSLVLAGGGRTTINSGGTLSTTATTTIELNGSQLVNNGRQTGVLTINGGSLAKGSGSFGSVTVADGGRFSPGNSPGTATAETFSFGAGGRYDFELTTANPRIGVDADLLVVTDTLFITAGTTANSVFTIGVVTLNQASQPAALSDFDSSLAYRFLLVDANNVSGYANTRFNVDTSGFLNNLNGGRFSVSLSGNDLYLDFNPMPVPEPATWAMWLAAAAVGAGLQARRRGLYGACGA